ncbi:hypothetical protein BV210_04890 [Halorientalis sp. IM1011]|uniref:hypothetical protein n=1 Tax=Halorientalis sp. IM1011 TaxID=1932360 RepID=UPI00097CC943|nr:hypothetical protein [Halorientalis sp. IM1011]AQL42090.1 hypothetical protein BV210_04890 [Halorientalis sp. IM1011]
MAGRVAYHHPENSRLSIDYLAYEFEEAEKRAAQCEADEITRIEECELNETVYVVYRGREVPDVTEDIEYELRQEVADMEWANQIITTRILRLFESIAAEKYEQEDERLAAYKEIEITRIPEALDRVTWDESVAIAGGELVSGLILRHALPNANHRTALGMLSLYFEAISGGFDMPSTATEEYDWEGWVNEYIEDSKRLLTVRRNVPRFRHLSNAGCTVVERKDGLRIHLNDYDLTMDHWDALAEYAQIHNRQSIEFAQEVLDRAGTPELQEGKPVTKQEFAERVQKME